MTHLRADILSLTETHSIVVPTNLEGVMGNGLARQVALVDPPGARIYTDLCRDKAWWSWPCLPSNAGWIFFPTKRRPQDQSTLDLVERSTQRLLGTTRQWGASDGEPIAVPMVGCGLGGLSRADVLPILEHYLTSDRFTLVEPHLFAVLDTETTGFSGEDVAVEIGIVLAAYTPGADKPGRITEVYHAFQDPGRPIPREATRVHGITDSMVRGRSIDQARVASMLNRVDFIVAHNTSFDRRFVTTPDSTPWLCSLKGINWSDRGYFSAKLQTLLTKHGINPGNKHRAIDDAKALLELLRIGDYFSMLTSNMTALQNIKKEVTAA
jgi:DNA polymerase III subunit epsilon